MPKSLSDKLHDEIDYDEGAVSSAFEAVAESREALADAVEQTGGDIEAAMVLIVQLLESKLADITTDAFNAHVRFARGRGDGR